ESVAGKARHDPGVRTQRFHDEAFAWRDVVVAGVTAEYPVGIEVAQPGADQGQQALDFFGTDVAQVLGIAGKREAVVAHLQWRARHGRDRVEATLFRLLRRGQVEEHRHAFPHAWWRLQVHQHLARWRDPARERRHQARRPGTRGHHQAIATARTAAGQAHA